MGQQPNRVHKYTHDPDHTGGISAYPDEVRQLAASIVLRAVADWVDLIIAEDKAARAAAKQKPKPVDACEDDKPRRKGRRRAKTPPNYEEIREFFNSDYGDFICGFIDMDTDVLLGRMERWLILYRSKGVVPHKISTPGRGRTYE